MSRTALLNDDQWARIEPLLPRPTGRAGRPWREHRQVVEGIIYRYRAGIPWRDLPACFGPWSTVWRRHRVFSQDGTWDRILTCLLAEADAAGEVDWRVGVDYTNTRAHQHGTNITCEPVTSDTPAPAECTGGVVELHEAGPRAS